MSSPVPNNPSCQIFQFSLDVYKKNSKALTVDYEEFVEEYSRFWYIIKLLVIYRNSGELNVRLLFNHLTILTNIFGIQSTQILMKLVLDKADYDIIVYALSLLHYIGFVPDDKFINIINEEYSLEAIPISHQFIKFMEEALDEAQNI